MERASGRRRWTHESGYAACLGHSSRSCRPAMKFVSRWTWEPHGWCIRMKNGRIEVPGPAATWHTSRHSRNAGERSPAEACASPQNSTMRRLRNSRAATPQACCPLCAAIRNACRTREEEEEEEEEAEEEEEGWGESERVWRQMDKSKAAERAELWLCRWNCHPTSLKPCIANGQLLVVNVKPMPGLLDAQSGAWSREQGD